MSSDQGAPQNDKKTPAGGVETDVGPQGALGATVGAALSTSTSSFEALDPHDPHLNHLAELAFSKTSQWINAELQSTQQDYKLLEQMNK